MPISFHAHVTEALNPTTVASMLLRLAIFLKFNRLGSIHISTPADRAHAMNLLGQNEIHVSRPRWAAIEGSYAAAFGPIVSIVSSRKAQV